MSRWRRDYQDDAHASGRYRDDYDVRYGPQRQFGGRYDGNAWKPITSRVGTGRRARIAVETGGVHATAVDDARKREAEEKRREWLERRERARAEIRRKRQPFRRPETSPARRPSPRRYHTSMVPSSRRDSNTSPSESDDAEVLRPVPPAQRVGSPASLPIPSPRIYVENLAESKDYDFQLPVRPQAVTYVYVEDVSFPLDAESNERPGKGSQGSRRGFNGSITEKSILQSRWVGSADDRGDLMADIGIPAAEPNGSEKSQDPLMRWYHLARPNMNFEEFIAAAQGVLQISEQKQRDVNELLRYVQRKYEKQRQHGRDLEPNYVSDLYLKDTSSKRNTCVMFLSFPYFCLEPYEKPTSGTPMHPLRPVLQAYFHSTPEKRELAQVITKSSSIGKSNCLHLSQVWCLIVDGDTMITCSRQDWDNLRGSAISKSKVSAATETAKIRVSFGNDRSWQIPVTDETTWPAFVSVFGESTASLENDDGVSADFKVNGESVGASQWPSLVEIAQTGGSIGLDLEQVLLQPSDGVQLYLNGLDFRSGTMIDSQTATFGSVEEAREGAEPSGAVHQTTVVDPPPSDIDEGPFGIFKHASGLGLEYLADSFDDVLKSNRREQEKAAYERGGAVKAFAVAQVQTTSGLPQTAQGDIIGPALYLFRFFWPFPYDHIVTDKYWGAVQQILQQDSQTRRAAHVDGVLADLTDNVIPAMEALSRDFAASAKDLDPLPDAYSKAFLHLVMVFVLLSQSTERHSFGVSNSTIRAHVKGLKDELSAGKREITTRLQSRAPDLEELEICSHSSLVALILNQFSQDVMHGHLDVASTYIDYFSRLEGEISRDPAPRSHQETLRYFLQEVEAILSTLQYQLSVLEAFELGLQKQRQVPADGSDAAGDDSFLLRYALGRSRQEKVLDDCKAHVTSRIDKFLGLQRWAEDLGEWHRNEIETNKDRQENAIMVFTIVTIIFLPLSFVSGVFGMNTTDVRDMPYSQWAYWAAAIPLTIIVLVGSLGWAGELEGLKDWVKTAFSRTRGSNAYQRLPDPVAYGAKRPEREQIEVRRLNVPGDRYYENDAPAARRRTTYPRRRYR